MADLLRAKYNQHKGTAKARGIEFDLSFDDWKQIWEGNFHKRGTGSGQLGMLRTRDEGGYTKGNVRLGTPKENQQERAVVLAVKKAQTPKPTAGGYYVTPPSRGSWLWRKDVFAEYSEDEEEYS